MLAIDKQDLHLLRFSRLFLLALVSALLVLCNHVDVAFAQVSPDAVNRLESDRKNPAIAQAWNRATNLDGETSIVSAARHDLLFAGPSHFRLQWNHQFDQLATSFTAQSIEKGLAYRQSLKAINPQIKLLSELRYRDSGPNSLPDDSMLWKRNGEGGRVEVEDPKGNFLLDYANPDCQETLAKRAKAIMDTGVVDGVMLDCWHDDAAQVELLKKVRAAIGEEALILINTNDEIVPLSTPMVNGYYMECYRSQSRAHWQKIAETLRYAEQHVREPKINIVETWHDSEAGRKQENKMRATTTFVLTHSDAYALFCDRIGHFHDWYEFWNSRVGRARAAGQVQKNGTTTREFDLGTVVYNPILNRPVMVSFDTQRLSAATGERGYIFVLKDADGDIFLTADDTEKQQTQN